LVWKGFVFRGSLEELLAFANESLRPLVKELEVQKQIQGFNFSFYSGEETHMSLRLDLAKKHERKVRKELGKLPIKPEVGEYSEQDKIAKFYELGSRWAFLLNDQIKKKRFQKEWIRDENFVLAFHGLCNSVLLGYYEEIAIHLKAVGRIGVTIGKFDEIRNDLTTINQKCVQWFLKPKVGNEGLPSGAIDTS
jgi:hypothetical protein